MKNAPPSHSETDLALRAAWLSYVGGYTQAQIAERLMVSRMKVHRLITAAHEMGAVQVFIKGSPESLLGLEDELKRRMDLEVCAVVPAMPAEEGVNPFANLGAQLIKEAASRTGEVAGDGTTTATVLAHCVVVEGLKAVAAGHNPMAVKRGVDRAVVVVVDELKRQARQVRGREDVARVATVSANDDSAIGLLIADAIERAGPDGVITVEEGRGLDSTLEVVEGLRIDRGYLSPYFVTDPESMSAVLEDALVLLTEFKVLAVHDLLPAMEHAASVNRPLVVIADDVEGEALAALVVNRLRGTVPSVAIRAPAAGDERREILEDLAVMTGARGLSTERGARLDKLDPADLGRAKRVVVDRETATLIEGRGKQADIKARIARLKRDLEQEGADWERERLRARLGRMTGGVGVIRVGAASELEMKERKTRIEDALAATRAAVEEGVVVGGGVALLRAQSAVRAIALPEDEAAWDQFARTQLNGTLIAAAATAVASKTSGTTYSGTRREAMLPTPSPRNASVDSRMMARPNWAMRSSSGVAGSLAPAASSAIRPSSVARPVAA